MSVATYLAGTAAIAAVVVALAWGARRVRAAVVPEWSGPPAWLADTVIALAALVTVSQLLGAMHLFSRWPVLVGLVTVGVGMGLVASRFGVNTGRIGDPADAKTGRGEEVIAAVLAGALIAAQWTTHVAVALGSGMTHPDTLWYHQPFAARFLQQHSFTGLESLGYSESRYFPFNSELVHAVSIMPFDRDVLSPLVNLGWAALALLAAWCVGRRRGLGPLCVLGAVVVLGLPTIAGTQPGQASNDLAAAALLLGAIALLLEGELTVGPTALAGTAVGLALATKLSVAVPLVVLTIGVVVLAWRAQRRAVAAAWVAPVTVFGGFWFARNWVVAENPLPFFDVRLGPLHFPERAEQSGPALIDHLTDASEWGDTYVPGLWDALGRGWPLVLALGLGGAALALVRGQALERLAAGAALAGIVGYVVSPNTAGISFSFNVRYLAPTLLIGFVLLPPALEHVASERWRRPAWIALAALIAVGATSPQRERIPAWPSEELLPGIVVGVAVLAGAVWFARSRPLRRIAVAGALLLAVVGGWVLQRHYLDHRYVDAGLHADAIYESFRDVQDERVAVIGTVEVLPMFGLDLSNRVTQEVGAGDRDTAVCTRWRVLLDGRDRYVVLDRFGVVFAELPPAEWFENAPNATEVLREGESVAYRVDGELRPPECAP